MILTTLAMEGTGLGYWDDWTMTKLLMQHLSSFTRKTDLLVLNSWVDCDLARTVGNRCPVSVSLKGRGFS